MLRMQPIRARETGFVLRGIDAVRAAHRWGRWRETGVAVTALIVAVISFAPWFHSMAARSHNGVDSVVTTTASAWTASTWWSVAVVLAIAGAGLWLLLDRLAQARGGPLRAWRWVSPAMAGVAAAMVGWQWWTIPPLVVAGGAWTTGGDGGDVGEIIRDHLVTYHTDGLVFEVAWGLPVGLTALSLLAAALVAGCLSVPAASTSAPDRR
ncbi:hypothetical protein GCM10010168_82310 [Actinoplanes ianthinogenes]|uniref:hypothetical protein n=1 Tax=Actinoplanes ianthinogenes TaxID=122358 RepID=UPI001671219F|nr:hypothetical protein [Actinoplanes ianthinogenes]GGR51126.1 hypothetical protein GCM10010168_82310 [Actinoplanes ianthinogenes]